MSDFMTSAQAREHASKNGWDVYVPPDTELTIDIDTFEQLTTFNKNYPILCNCFQNKFEYTLEPSPSCRSHHHHIKLTWNGPQVLTVPERIALQAALGSDPQRELSSMVRYLNDDPEPIILFKRR